MKSVIDINNISFSYGKLKALKNINLKLEPGIYGLLGPNGAGKTTLLKILLGFLTPDTGNGSIFGFNIIKNIKQIRKKIGYMPEDETLIPDLDGISLTSYLAELSGLSSENAMKRAHEVLFYVNLEEERYRQATEYSTGMKQKLKLAQAIVHSPDLLLLDEPTSGMDPQARKDMINLIKKIAREGETSIIYSSHILSDIEESCNQVIILNKGKTLAIEKIADLKKNNFNSYEIKLKNNIENFLSKLKENKAKYSLTERGIFKVNVPSNITPQKLFKLASITNTQIRHFRNTRTTLEERFLNYIEEENGN